MSGRQVPGGCGRDAGIDLTGDVIRVQHICTTSTLTALWRPFPFSHSLLYPLLTSLASSISSHPFPVHSPLISSLL